MKPLSLTCLALLGAFLLPADLSAQAAPKMGTVRLGLPSRGEGGRMRNGSWAPVYVTLKAGPQDVPANLYTLAVETADMEDTPYRYAVRVPGIDANSEKVVTAYTVPVNEAQEYTIKLEANGRVIETIPKVNRTMGDGVAPDHVLFLAIGQGLGQLKRAGEKLDEPDKPGLEDDTIRRKFALIDSVPLLPDRWFGYDAADAIVLGTSDVRLVTGLLEASDAKRNALLEWVRRGGKLVMSVGSNAAEVDKLLTDKLPLIDCKVAGDPALKGMALPTLSIDWCKREAHQGNLEKVELARLTPGLGVQVLVREGERPVMVQAAFGMGRVVLVGFDLDARPFTAWNGNVDFWKQLQAELTPSLAPHGNQNMGKLGPPGAFGMMGQGTVELQSDLKRGIEMFEEVPPVPFGWVALFLVFYIALVGPLDYLVLKKLLKRLELTWVTFPVTVILVSVLAYFTAYALKGDDLRINKIDLIDIDLQGGKQIYGQTWVGLFSPRVQSFTMGLEPASPVWTAPVPDGAPGPTVTLLDSNDTGLRTGSQGLFPKPYEYAEDAVGIRRVPVRVWAARSFAASWRAPVPADMPPIEVRGMQDKQGHLSHNPETNALVGNLTNNLSVELQGASLFYLGKWYSLGTIVAGQTVPINPLFARDARGQGKDVGQWFTDPVLSPELPLSPAGKPIDNTYLQGKSAYLLVKSLMFHQLSDNQRWTNTGLRSLDQSWRLRPAPVYPRPPKPAYREEAVLVARTPLVTDKSEPAAGHPASPSRVWMGALPGDRPDRPALAGYLTQETFLRVYIPVQSSR